MEYCKKTNGLFQNERYQAYDKFSGKPYIDVRKSFYSLLPDNLSEKFKNKLVNISLEILKKNPEYHDKIEFLCSVNSFNLNTKQKIKEIYKNKITKEEGNLLYLALRELTYHNSDLSDNSIFSKSVKKIIKLKDKQSKYDLDSITNLKLIIRELRTYGIIPFSILARNAFIAQSLINSLEENKIFSKNEKILYQSSIETYATELIKDSKYLINKKISFKDFKKKYGHLRPGTYNIESENYNSMGINNFKKTLNLNLKNSIKFYYTKKFLKNMSTFLKK